MVKVEGSIGVALGNGLRLLVDDPADAASLIRQRVMLVADELDVMKQRHEMLLQSVEQLVKLAQAVQTTSDNAFAARQFFRNIPRHRLGLHRKSVLGDIKVALSNLEMTCSKLELVLSPPGEQVEPADFALLRDEVLHKAGGSYSLTEAANGLGITRQGLHKKISMGAVLGMLRGGKLVVPKLQFHKAAAGRLSLIPGIEQTLAPFNEAEAGGWSALQFLIEHDPNLGAVPITVLRAGEVSRVVDAARAYLGLDEGREG